MSMVRERPTQPEIPAARLEPVRHERSAVYRRVPVSGRRDPLADLVEEVVVHPRDPRAEP